MQQTVHILLVEDNKGDVVLITEALEEANRNLTIQTLSDGEQAINYLGESSGLPDIILLDINLPRVNGHEVLRFIKSSEKLRKIPVVMLTTSSAEADVTKSYNLHANCFITKPADVYEYNHVVESIEKFWVKVARLPNIEQG